MKRNLTRRTVITSMGAIAAGSQLGWRRALAAPADMLKKAIPATGERVPVIGMGSWITFNVGVSTKLRDARVEVLRAFFEAGGAMVDSSPMYGSSEEVIGYCLARLDNAQSLFSATKVWTPLQWYGVRQMATSQKLWGTETFDLLQIHNLLNWEGHLETLLEWKAQGRVRYIGVTTSHGRRHADLERIMATQPIDFVQFTYNVLDRAAEQRLLPLAAERGLAVIINRPFQRGALFDIVDRQPLPDWAGDCGCANWAQLLLKFVVSHPAVTCAIPATSRVDHMVENMGAAYGRLPDGESRERLVAHIENL